MFHLEALTLGRLRKGHIQGGRVELVVGGGLCLGLRNLEVSHLELNY